MPHSKKLIISCFLGNVLEWYEFAIFGYLTKYLSHLFFPATDNFTSLLLTYGAFATGFIMRPIGALIMGHIGDKWGRKSAFILSLMMMAVPTTAISLLPTYDQVGLWAPLLLIFCRLAQGLSLGGEFTGSIIYLIENASNSRRALAGSWADLGSSTGMIMASLTAIILNTWFTPEQVISWAWRLPFAIGLLFGIIGYIVRRDLLETSEFRHTPKDDLLKTPLREVFYQYPRTFCLAITFLAINAAGYYLLIIYLPQQIPHITTTMTLTLSLMSLCIMMPANVIGAHLSDKIGQVPCLLFGAISCLILATPTVYSAYHGNFITNIVLHALFAISLGFCYGPRSSFIVQLFPVPVRYSAVAVSYNIANAIFGGTAPLLASLLVQQTGNLLAPGYMIMTMAAISFLSTLALRPIAYKIAPSHIA
jgi:MHS family proline/betaine transporter-like MFS transporter